MHMPKSLCGTVVLMVAGLLCGGMANEALAEAGTGSGSGAPGLSGTGSTTEGAGAKRDPHSGTMVPEARQQQGSRGIAEQPPGLGEQGSGQSQSTMERSGGKRSGTEESIAKSSAESGDGATEKAMKQQEQKKKTQ